MWYVTLLSATRVGASGWQRGGLFLGLPVSIAIILSVLRHGADHEVRADHGFLFLLTFIGLVWVSVCTSLFSWLGVSVRDDAIERNNPAATIASLGGLLGVTFCYAGGNIGEGPSLWNSFFSAGLATAGWFALWGLLEFGGHISVSIAEERDQAAGWRLAAFLIATGLIFGRAVAGDWESGLVTLRDFAWGGWPALPLLAVAVALERWARPSVRRPFPNPVLFGIIPALIYVGCALGLPRWIGPYVFAAI